MHICQVIAGSVTNYFPFHSYDVILSQHNHNFVGFYDKEKYQFLDALTITAVEPIQFLKIKRFSNFSDVQYIAPYNKYSDLILVHLS